MKNKTLALTRSSIPYIPALRNLSGSIAASILMQQLDYWFAKMPDGFYKFLEPCNNKLYREGESWAEELNFSKEELMGAFSKICLKYKSKKAFDEALEDKDKDVFEGKYFYCSYHDRMRGVTFYFRNHTLLDSELDKVFSVSGESPLTVSRDLPLTDSRKSGKPTYVNGDLPLTEVGKTHLDITEDYIQKNTQKKEKENPKEKVLEKSKTDQPQSSFEFKVEPIDTDKNQQRLKEEVTILNSEKDLRGDIYEFFNIDRPTLDQKHQAYVDKAVVHLARHHLLDEFKAQYQAYKKQLDNPKFKMKYTKFFGEPQDFEGEWMYNWKAKLKEQQDFVAGVKTTQTTQSTTTIKPRKYATQD
jgi:hypothetical protein